MVREEGLEPSRLAALVPKTSVYTISPLARVRTRRFSLFFKKTQIFSLDFLNIIKYIKI